MESDLSSILLADADEGDPVSATGAAPLVCSALTGVVAFSGDLLLSEESEFFLDYLSSLLSALSPVYFLSVAFPRSEAA